LGLANKPFLIPFFRGVQLVDYKGFDPENARNLQDMEAPPSWPHLPAGCRRYAQHNCPGIS